MRLYMETSHESDWARGQWRGIAKAWQDAGHVELVDSMEAADAILITLADCKASYLETIARVGTSGAYAQYPEKSFVFDTQDSPIGLYPGLYCSLRRFLFSKARHRTGCYMQSFNEFIGPGKEDDANELRYLFSFQGNVTSRTRVRLFAMNYRRDDVLIQKTEPFWSNTGGVEQCQFKQQYAENILRSRYVLCPRGIGTSTFRLFETPAERARAGDPVRCLGADALGRLGPMLAARAREGYCAAAGDLPRQPGSLGKHGAGGAPRREQGFGPEGMGAARTQHH